MAGHAQSVGAQTPFPAAGLGISGDVALNTVTDDTEASISDAGAPMTGGAVKASDQTIIASIAGAITARTAGSGGGVAGWLVRSERNYHHHQGVCIGRHDQRHWALR